jgi:hypothetical protein
MTSVDPQCNKTYAFEIVCQPHKHEGHKSILQLTPRFAFIRFNDSRYESETRVDFPFIYVEPVLSQHVNNPVNIFELRDIVDRTPAKVEPIVVNDEPLEPVQNE